MSHPDAYRFVVRPRWIAMHVLVLAAVSLFAVAGSWQLRRLGERREHNALVMERRAMPPVTGLDPGDLVHRRARLGGTYDTSREVVLLGRGSAIGPGNHVLTPLLLDDDRAILVDRGLIPGDFTQPPVRVAAPPSGEVLVEGFLQRSEGAAPLAGDTPGRLDVVSRIDVDRLGRQMPYELAPVYLLLSEQRPPPGDIPRPVPPVELSEGSHLAYAVQWFSFIPIALIVYGALLRREAGKRRRERVA